MDIALFLTNFESASASQVSTVTLTNSTTEPPSSRAALLIFGNCDRLFDAISLPLPIWIPETSYVILVREFPPSSDSVFRDLWIHNHVTNVLMIAWREPGKVQSYNPFFDELTENQIETSSTGNTSNTTNNIRKIMRNKMSNMNGHPIRVTMFPTRLKAIPLPNGTFTGYDGIILQTLAKHMNFTPIITIPPDGHKYGWKEKNGSFTGKTVLTVSHRSSTKQFRPSTPLRAGIFLPLKQVTLTEITPASDF